MNISAYACVCGVCVCGCVFLCVHCACAGHVCTCTYMCMHKCVCMHICVRHPHSAEGISPYFTDAELLH